MRLAVAGMNSRRSANPFLFWDAIMSFRIVRIALTMIVALASLPLSLVAMEHGFGLGAALLVPTCCLGFWLSLASHCRSQRIGWFAFSSVCVLLLPLGVWWQRNIEYVLNWVQDFIRSYRPTFFYSAAESAALISAIMLPWSAACLLG